MLINYKSFVKHYIYSKFPNITKFGAMLLYKRKLSQLCSYVSTYYKEKNEYPLFNHIEIETINRCNNVCPFCPVNKNDDIREYKKMESALFYKIIDNLAALDFTGTVHLYSNNEPFLDDRIEEFAKYVRVHVPRARIYIFTNGILLTEKRFFSIIPYIDLLYIDNYNDRLEMIIPVKKIYDLIKHRNESKKVSIHLRKYTEVLSTRGGQAPNYREKDLPKLQIGCTKVFYQMVIRPDGKVSLCCNDVYGTYNMGDCNSDRLEVIWQNEKYNKIRATMMKYGRQGIGAICKNCDVITY